MKLKDILQEGTLEVYQNNLDRAHDDIAAVVERIIRVSKEDVKQLWDMATFLEEHPNFKEIHSDMDGYVVKKGSDAERQVDDLLVPFKIAVNKHKHILRKINKLTKFGVNLKEDRPSPEEEKHCLRKHRYPTMKEARSALLRLWKKKRPERAFYPCKYCKQFHLTSKKPTGIATT